MFYHTVEATIEVVSDPSFLAHTVLDVVGMIPVVGEAADLLNAGLYALEGDHVNAALSLAAMVPVAGAAVAVAKVGKNAIKAGTTALDSLRIGGDALKHATPPKPSTGSVKPPDAPSAPSTPGAKGPDAPAAKPAADTAPPAAPGGKALDGDTLSPAAIDKKLQDHKNSSVQRYEDGDIAMSSKQVDAAANNPNLEPAFRGQVIDADLKKAVQNDPELDQLYVTRSGEAGPDFYDIDSETWWDATTEKQWDAHVDRYADPYGAGVPLITDVP